MYLFNVTNIIEGNMCMLPPEGVKSGNGSIMTHVGKILQFGTDYMFLDVILMNDMMDWHHNIRQLQGIYGR
jgi:hypothetical protein